LTAPKEVTHPASEGADLIASEASESKGASLTAPNEAPPPESEGADFAVTVHHEDLGPTGMVARFTGEDLKDKVLRELWERGIHFNKKDVYIRRLERNLHGEVVAGVSVRKDETVTSEMVLLGTTLVVKEGCVSRPPPWPLRKPPFNAEPSTQAPDGASFTGPDMDVAGLAAPPTDPAPPPADAEPTTQAPDGASLTGADMDVDDGAGRGAKSKSSNKMPRLG
jgi:hypothetical protein